MTYLKGKEFQEILEFSRKGRSLVEVCDFILSSPRHLTYWQESQVDGKNLIEIWQFLFRTPQRKKSFLQWQERLTTFELSLKDIQSFLLCCSPEIRKETLLKLSSLTFTSQPLLPLYIALLEKEHSIQDTLEFLADQENLPVELLPLLLEILAKENRFLSYYVVSIVGKMGKKAEKASSLLEKGLLAEDPYFRGLSAIALGRIGINLKKIMPLLIELFSTAERSLQKEIAFTLGEIGSAAKLSIPTILPAINDADPETAVEIIRALGKMKAKETVPFLLQKGLYHEYSAVRKMSAWSLGEIGTHERYLVPALIQTIRFDGWPICQEAGVALKKVDTDGKKVMPLLQQMLKEPDEQIRKKAIWVTGLFEENALMVWPELMKALQDPYWNVRKTVIETLGKLGKLAVNAVPELKEIVEQEAVERRDWILQIIEMIEN